MFNKTMGCMVREVFKGSYHVSLLTAIITIAGLAYVISPFDIVPDSILFFGWLDDLLVVFLVIKRLQKESQRYIRFKVMERRGH